MKRLLVTLALLSVSAPLFAQTGPRAVDFQQIPPVAKTVSLAGPRFGITLLTDQMVGKLKTDAGISVRNAVSQFGWQFERQFYTKDDGPTVLNEWVLLAGGLDQGVFLPSLNWLVGVRTHEGAEFGIGPNISASGVGLVLAAGMTMRAGVLNMPMNFAVVPSKLGPRVSVLTGFTLRK
ncbi:MAG: hypothetical protein ABMA15_13390 [Vicinamibacterales bacterium]